MCQCHGSRFDITTGAVISGPATEPLELYEVREEGGKNQAADLIRTSARLLERSDHWSRSPSPRGSGEREG